MFCLRVLLLVYVCGFRPNLFDFYLLISGLGYPVLVVFHQQNIFSIKNKHQEPYTSSKQQERHNKS